MKTLREKNAAVIEKSLLNPEVMSFGKMMEARYGKNPMTDVAFKEAVLSGTFNWRALRQELALKEADAASSFVQFLRAGVQTITNNAYMATPTTFDDWVTTVASKLNTELYAPNQGVGFPRQVGPSEKFPEVGAAALNMKLENLKFGTMYVVERELLEDDQTGTVQQQTATLGEYMKVITEVLCYGKLASVANMQYIDYKIPVSETKPSNESNYPWSQAFQGGGANRPASYGAFSKDNVQNAQIGLMNQVNLQGIKMLVQGNRIIVGPKLQFDAAILLNSTFYPSGAASAGVTGGAFAINPIKGIADLTVSRFVFKNDGTVTGNSTAWYLVDGTKPWFVLQLREPILIEQEAPNAGTSFELKQYRFSAMSRMNADFIDPRFAWQGNDGSV